MNFDQDFRNYVRTLRSMLESRHARSSSQPISLPRTCAGQLREPQFHASLTETEYAKLLDAIEEPVVRLVVQVMWETRLTLSEVINLSLADLDFEDSLVRVRLFKAKMPHRNSIGYKKIPHSLREKLVTYRNEHRADAQPHEPFFVIAPAPVKVPCVRSELHRAFKKIGLRNFRPSDLPSYSHPATKQDTRSYLKCNTPQDPEDTTRG